MSEASAPNDDDLRPVIRAEIDRVCPEMRTGLVMDVPMPPLTQAQLLAALRPLPDGAGAAAAVVAFYREAGLPVPRPGERPAWLDAARAAYDRAHVPEPRRPDRDLERAILAEFARIGLRMEEMPGVVLQADELGPLLERLKSVPADGSSWAELFPNALPRTNWSPELEEWRKPIGGFDDLAPEGAAIVAHFETSVSDDAWRAIVDEIRQRGFPLHSWGILERRTDMLITGLVLRPGATPHASRATVELVCELLHDQPGIMSLWIPRYGVSEGARDSAPPPTAQ